MDDVLGLFLYERFVQSSEYGDKIKLKDVWAMLKGTDYYDQVGFKTSRKLSQNLKNRGLTLTLVGGAMVLRHFKYRFAPVDWEQTAIEAFVRISPSSSIRSKQVLHQMIVELGIIHPSNRTAALKVALKVVKAFGDVPGPIGR